LWPTPIRACKHSPGEEGERREGGGRRRRKEEENKEGSLPASIAMINANPIDRAVHMQ
jgi:hypothetical protein